MIILLLLLMSYLSTSGQQPKHVCCILAFRSSRGNRSDPLIFTKEKDRQFTTGGQSRSEAAEGEEEMGNSQSNRKITVVNDEVAGVIKISDSVVRRLKGEIEQERDREAKTTQQPVSQIQGNAETPKSSTSAMPIATSSGNTQTKEPNAYEHFMEEAHLTALKIRQDKEAEIRRVQEHWRKQLMNLTDHYSKIAEQTEAEYRAAVEDVERSFSKESFSNICSEQKSCVLNCYKEHKDKPLYCAKEVKDFASCVNKFRLESLDKPTR